MRTEDHDGLCEEERLQVILRAVEAGSGEGARLIEEALTDFPEDPRLHFLRGSLLIGEKRFIEAHEAMSRALAIAPDFAIARFQLGFFELTSGEVEAARATWEPLKSLPQGHWMRSFVAGLEHLVADRFTACIAALREGIANNTENLPLNHDMALIIAKCEEILGDQTAADHVSETEDDVSATSILLGSRRF